jgi:tRNA-specific 2-thiouridylase
LIAAGMHWISGVPPENPFKCVAKTRYRQADQDCTLNMEAGHCRVTFRDPQRAVTPGQFVVFYDREICLGGAIIESTIP